MKNILLARLFGNSERSIANWRIENRPIIKLIEIFFEEEDIVEFINTGNIRQLQRPSYSIIKRSLKTRIVEFRNKIGFMETAYVKYLLKYWQAVLEQVSQHKYDNYPTDEKKLIIDLIKNSKIKISFGDMANFDIFSKKIKERITSFYEDLEDVEISFILEFPNEFEEIIRDSFSATEMLALRIPPNDL